MRKKELLNNLKIILISLLLSAGYWIICNKGIINRSPSFETFREINASIYGYSSLQSYFLIYMFPFLIMLNFYSKRESDFIIVRYKDRKQIVYFRIKTLLRTILLILIPHFLINIIGISVTFNFTYLISVNYFLYEFLQLVMVSIFFFTIGIFYQCCIDYVKYEISIFIVSLITISYYFVNRIFLNYQLIKELCIKDLSIIHSFSESELWIAVIKYLVTIIILLFIMVLKIKEKDIYEK